MAAERQGVAQAWMSRLAPMLRLRHSPRLQRAFKASSWSIGGYGASLVLRFISRLVLAKLLTDASPMGNIAVVVTIISGLEMISDLGIGINIIQHPRGSEDTFLGTAFSIQVLRGAALWLLAAALAYPIAGIYHDAQLGPLLLFASTAVLVRGFGNPRIFTLNRSLDLRWPTLLSASSEVVAFAVTVGWALVHASAWALVGGTIASAIIYAAGSHLIGARLKPAWDRKLASQIVRFGGWTVVSTGTYFLASRGENLMLKGSVPDIEFGCFAFASMLVTTPVMAITQLGNQVLFPLLSNSVRDSREAAEKRYRLAKVAFTAVATCIACGAILLGPAAARLLHLNSSYNSLGWMVQFLGFRAAQDVYGLPVGTILLASGQVRYSAAANVVRLLVLIGGLILTLHPFGIRGAMWVLVGAPLVAYSALIPGLRRYMPRALGLEVNSMAVFLGCVAAAVLVAQGSGMHILP